MNKRHTEVLTAVGNMISQQILYIEQYVARLKTGIIETPQEFLDTVDRLQEAVIDINGILGGTLCCDVCGANFLATDIHVLSDQAVVCKSCYDKEQDTELPQAARKMWS